LDTTVASLVLLYGFEVWTVIQNNGRTETDDMRYVKSVARFRIHSETRREAKISRHDL
jgi:hypothetical protein